MDKILKKELVENILHTCLFSEYLPSEFSTEYLNTSLFSIKNSNIMAPVVFTMDKYNDLGNRRYISIPEIGSFLNAVEALSNGKILEKILDINADDDNSLSKILNEKHEVKQFSDGYEFYITSDGDKFYIIEEEIVDKDEIAKIDFESDFMSNLKVKIEKSKACNCILHLDISNFYNSIYTHYISALTQGAEWANEQFQIWQNKRGASTEEYRELKNLDDKVIAMNLKRTHGLLIGPRISFIIAEALLSQIDIELKNELDKINVDFVRYVDDYDVFINDRQAVNKIKNIFNKIFQNYGLSLNDTKTKIEEFPFYTYINYDTLNRASNLENSFGIFGQIEKSKVQNGALLYFCRNILSKSMNSNVSLSLSLSILKNMPKALITSCKNIACYHLKNGKNQETLKLLYRILENFSNNHFDLECIWILYTLLKIDPTYEIDDTILNKLNEVALVIYLYESANGKSNGLLIKRAKKSGWLLNYELYFNDLIEDKALSANLDITDVDTFKQLKAMAINFYKPKHI